MKKFQKIFWPQSWCDPKKLVPRSPPLKNSESRVFDKWKNSKKIFDLKFGVTQESWYPDPPVWKIQSPESSLSEKILKNFDLKFDVTKKSWCPDPSLENVESRVLIEWKNCEKFFDLKFGMTKKSWCPHKPPPPNKIQSPEHSVNKKILNNFGFKFGMTKISSPGPSSDTFSPEHSVKEEILKILVWPKKSWCPAPPLKNSESRVLGKGNNLETFFDLKFGMTKNNWPGHPLWKIQSKVLSKWKNSEKIFGLKFGMTKKSWCPDPHSEKIQSPESLLNEKIPKNFLVSNLVWLKKVDV